MDQEMEEAMLQDSDAASNSSDEENSELERKATELESQLSENKYLYDVHVELVGLYKQLADLTSMRMAYRRFADLYPLTEKLWLSWLTDEMSLANTAGEKKEVLALFERATEDYLSINIWLHYVQYSLGCCELDETRSILNRALNVGGLHVESGSLLWDILRELEMLALPSPDSENYADKLQRVIDAFKRQLSVPLLFMEKTYDEWCDFVKKSPTEIDTSKVEWGYGQAQKALQEYKPFEDRLVVSAGDAETWDIFREYIKVVKDPSLTLCLYERAVEKLCLMPEVWVEYCKYASKLGNVVLKITRRALRNVNWNEELWVYRLRMLEKFERPKDEVLKCFEDGIASVPAGLDLWMTYLDYNIRNDQDRLMKLFDQAEQQVTQEMDPYHKISRLHARLAAKKGDVAKSRALWGKVMQDRLVKTFAHYWTEYVNMERQYGDAASTRNVFKRALVACKDWPQSLADEWLQFERLEGTIEDILLCMEKCKALQDKLKATTAVVEEVVAPQGSEENNGKRKSEDGAAKAGPKKFKVADKHVRRNQGAPPDLDPQRSVFVSNLSSHTTEQQLREFFPKGKVTLATNNQGVSRCFGFVQFETTEEAEAALKRDREPINKRPVFVSRCKGDNADRQSTFKFSTNAEANKLFVKGLPIKYSQEDVEAIFKPYNCTEVRLVTHRSGQSKGLAYVDFANEKDAEAARKATDQTTVSNFVISVAISAPPAKNTRAPREPTGKPKVRLQIPLVPRVLQTKADEVKVTPKTKEDFRKMFVRPDAN